MFSALERDLVRVARYIELCDENSRVFSTELAKLLLSACSEIDVVAKEVCFLLDHTWDKPNIDCYRRVIMEGLPELAAAEVRLKAYDIQLQPWSEWNHEENPGWWQSYNKVKHRRAECFADANLLNVLEAIGALMIIVYYLYLLEEGVASSPVRS